MTGTHTSIGLHFVSWYYKKRPTEITKAYVAYAAAFSSLFSIIFLLKTLFAPWKSIRDTYPSKGFDVAAIMQTFTLNMTARCIGAIIRLSALLMGIVLQVALFVGFAFYLLLWILFPVIGVLAIPFLVYVSF